MESLYHYKNGKLKYGLHDKVVIDLLSIHQHHQLNKHGDCTNLYGDIAGLRGDLSGLSGCANGYHGDCTGIIGDLEEILRGQVIRYVPWQSKAVELN
jgi:hypothetical protein